MLVYYVGESNEHGQWLWPAEWVNQYVTAT
jgi:hypothetical protein